MCIYSCVIYIYDVYLVCNDGRLKTKKNEFFHFFAEYHNHDTRQSWESGTLSFPALPSVMGKALGKENPKKGNKLCRVPDLGTRQRIKKNTHFFAECRRVALGKGAVTVTWPPRRLFFAECPTCDTRQRSLCREGICRQLFAECSTRQRLCRVQSLLCQV